MRNLIRILLITLTITAVAWSAAAAADRYRDDSEYGRKTLTGVVTDINPVRLELSVRFDDRGIYRIRSDEAEVRLDQRRGDFRDIREGDTIRIYGDVRSDRSMDAYIIDFIDPGDRYDEPRAGLDVGRTITVAGNVSGAETSKGWFDMDSDQGRIRVIVGRHTDIREMGRTRSLQDFRYGDYVVVTGRVEDHSTLTANTINLNGPHNKPGAAGLRTILMGEVSRETSILDRDLTVRTPIGDRRVTVPRGADVRRDGRSISVHEIKKGETVRAMGSWSGDTFVAQDVEVIISRNEHDGSFGRIERIDYTSREFRLTGRDGDYWISARDAEVIDDSGRHVSFRDLKNGQNVWVYGERRGDTIYADRVERGEYYYQTSKDYKPASHSTR